MGVLYPFYEFFQKGQKPNPIDMPLTLAYWDIRGLAQPARLMLHHAAIPFEDKHFVCADNPPYDKSCWTSIKNTLGFDFPNLPYVIDGDIKVSQSNAGGLAAKRARIDMAE